MWNGIGSYGLNGWTYKPERKEMFEDMDNTDIDDDESGGGGYGGGGVGSGMSWWMEYWHKQFNTAGPWTKAGGVQPEAWPKWMRKYKDY